MQKARMLAIIVILACATCVAMAYANKDTASVTQPEISRALPVTRCVVPTQTSGIIKVSGQTMQDKVLDTGVQTISYRLNLEAETISGPGAREDRKVDMVVVLDKSGSMGGNKLAEARQAIVKLVENLTVGDRFALVTYSSGAATNRGLTRISNSNRADIIRDVTNIRSGGGTDLGAGLHQGMEILKNRHGSGNMGRLVLVSDGRANQGIVDPAALENMASMAIKAEFAVSTVGVGHDFNEVLMGRIADGGAGKYYFLENPAAFASVFSGEFKDARLVAAANLGISVPVPQGMTLINASGYPIRMQGNTAIIHPGDMLSGQKRTIILDFKVDAGDTGSVFIPSIHATYTHGGKKHISNGSAPITIARVRTEREVIASLDESTWKDKVLKDEYGDLMKRVGRHISMGDRESARKEAKKYSASNVATASQANFSPETQRELKKKSEELEAVIEDSFAGKPAAVAAKQRRNSKVLHSCGTGVQQGLSIKSRHSSMDYKINSNGKIIQGQ